MYLLLTAPVEDVDVFGVVITVVKGEVDVVVDEIVVVLEIVVLGVVIVVV